MARRRSGPPWSQSVQWELASALEAMSAPELRACVRTILDELNDERRARIVDSLVASATRSGAGWKPNRPHPPEDFSLDDTSGGLGWPLRRSLR